MHVANYTSDNRRWDHSLAALTEIENHSHTHYSKEGNFESRLDRAFWTLPPWINRHMRTYKHTFKSAYQYHQNGVSDHSPIGLTISPRSSLPPDQRPIPSFVIRHPLFRENLAKIEEQDGLKYQTLRRDSWDSSLNRHNPFRALETYNRGIRKAAAMTRNFLMQHDNSMMSSDIIASSISRCVFFNDVYLAKF